MQEWWQHPGQHGVGRKEHSISWSTISKRRLYAIGARRAQSLLQHWQTSSKKAPSIEKEPCLLVVTLLMDQAFKHVSLWEPYLFKLPLLYDIFSVCFSPGLKLLEIMTMRLKYIYKHLGYTGRHVPWLSCNLIISLFYSKFCHKAGDLCLALNVSIHINLLGQKSFRTLSQNLICLQDVPPFILPFPIGQSCLFVCLFVFGQVMYP